MLQSILTHLISSGFFFSLKEEPLRLQYKISRKQTGKSAAAVATAGNSNNFKQQQQQTTSSASGISPGQQQPAKNPWSSRTDLSSSSASSSSSTTKSSSSSSATNGTSLKRPRPNATGRPSPSCPAKQPRLIHHLPPPAPSPAIKSPVRKNSAGKPKDSPSVKPSTPRIIHIRRPSYLTNNKPAAAVEVPKKHPATTAGTKEASVSCVPQLVNIGGSPKKKRGRTKHRKNLLLMTSETTTQQRAEEPSQKVSKDCFSSSFSALVRFALDIFFPFSADDPKFDEIASILIATRKDS